MSRPVRALRGLATLCVVLLAPIPVAAAAHLQLDGSIDAATTLHLRATNGGDVGAIDVRPRVAYQRHALEGDPAALPPGATHEWTLTLPASARPGTFPAIVHVHYTEGDDTASVPVVVPVSVPMVPPSEVEATLDTAPGPGLVTVRLHVENPGARALAGRLVVVLPSVLHTEPESEPVQVAAGEQRVLPIPIESRGARTDVAYPVYTVLEYEDDGAHHTLVAHLDVKGGASAGRAAPLTIGVLALVAAVVVVAMASRAAARRRPA